MRVMIILAAMLAGLLVPALAQAAPRGEGDRRLVIVTLDGLPWTEVFRGADAARLEVKAFAPEPEAVKAAFAAPGAGPEVRTMALMPFLNGVVARQGVLAGDRDHGSCVAVGNDRWFSYPGYNEILTGRPDPAIKSNAHGPNANVTLLEWLNHRPGFAGRVAAVTSWGVFNDILNPGRSGVALNAGWEGRGPRSPANHALATLQADAARIWPDVRQDGFTHAWALDVLRQGRARVLYVSYGETDDFAHDGRYDQVLWSANRNDRFIGELWAAIQANPAWRGRTNLIVTTDHGRGQSGGQSWRSHMSGLAGSDEIWLAALGPDIQPGATVGQGGACATNGQVAATALTLLGQDWRAFDDKAAPPLPILKPGR